MIQGDIASPGVAERLVAAAEETGRPLRGVVHAAAVIDDQIVATLSRESLERVWAPKAVGAWRLHQATADRELDWWVGFSSVASLLGSPGQSAYACANAWLDALVSWRRASGLPATTINWGQWADVGIARSLTLDALDPISPAEGIEALDALLAGNLAQVGVARLRLDRAAAAFPEIQQLGYFANLAGELETESDDDWSGPDALHDMDPGEVNGIVTARLRRRVSAIMGYPDDRAVDDGPAVDRTGNGFADGRANQEHRPRGLRRGAPGGTSLAGCLTGGRHDRSDRSARPHRARQHRAHERSSRSSASTCRSTPTSGHAAKGRTTSVSSNIELPLATNSLPPNAIAVVGMAGRFPGADSVSTFWDNLRRGEESIVDLSEDELIAAGVGEKALANHSYVRRAALMDGIDEFDADFFGFTPHAARMMDPQHRLFLQCAWHALEDAGYDPAQIDGSVGVYGTSSASGYLLHNLMSHHDPHMIIGQGATFDMVNLSLQNDKDHLATRVSHQFNLRGPALSVQTACSSSLVAVHLACQSIMNGECDMALAGGASIRVPHRVGYWHEPGSMVSATGHCRPFDVRSDGTIFGSGVGVVVLKPLEAAVEDGDQIHAVIRGSAINNDGSTKMNYAAPNAAGQAGAIAEAHEVADIDASTVSYIETHGTGTPLGDPIEIEGLRQAFGISTATRPGPCFVGSVKSNIGHLEAASGIAGLIKAILCLKHRAIPATLHFTHPNPELHLDRGPFVVRSEYGPWEWEGVRRAGVSSFGVGGTNAHVVLEEAPAVSAPDIQAGPQVLLLSARTAESLEESRTALAAALSGQDELRLPDVAYTLARRRKENIRLAAVVNDQQHAAAVLGTAEDDNIFVGESVHTDAPSSQRVVFLFPGQGAQHVGMAHGLYESEPVFAEHFDQCAAAFADELGIDLRAEVFNGAGRSLERTDRAQPALFTVEYALAKLIESYGVRPAALAGHSIGEYVAATMAGVFDLPTAAKAVSVRARLMHAAARGVMIAVALSPDAIAEYLSPDVDIATVNDPGSCVVAGSDENIRKFSDRLAQEGIVARRVRTSHAFHSRLMDPVIPEFKGFLSGLMLREPQIPLLSNITGTWMSADEATNPATWARQIRATVRFSDELDALLADPSRVLIEVGPGGSLTSSAMRHPRWSSQHRAIRLMRHQAQNRRDRDTFLLALGQLAAAGIDVDWTPLSAGHQPRLVSLPGYPFVRQRHWVEHNATNGWAGGTPAANGMATAPTPAVSGDTHAATNGKSQMEDDIAAHLAIT